MNRTMKKLFVVDGNSIINRAYYGIRPLTTKEGIHTNAVYGMITILEKQLDAVKPDICVIAFDRREPTFRHKAYAEYKAGRHASPDELRMQFPYAKECAAAMGFTVAEQPGYEADDILGTLSAQAVDNGYEAYLLTGDRDALQLIGDNITVLLATNKETVVFDRAHFIEEYGVTPEQFVDVKALMGDSSDNIPGVAGVGEKTALKLISEYRDLDTLYDGLEDKNIAKGVKAKLTADRENAFFSRMLATIVRDAPLDNAFSMLKSRAELEDRPALRELFIKLEFSALIKRMNLDCGMEGLPACPVSTQTEEAAPLPTAPMQTDAAFLGTLSADPILSITVGEENGAAQLYVSDGTALYACPLDDGLTAFLSARHVVTHDAKLLYHTLHRAGLPIPTVDFDTMLAGYVMNPSESDYNLPKLAVQYLDTVIPDGAHEAAQTAVTARLYPVLRDKVAADGMERLYYDIELPLAGVLFRMEVRGFRVDVDGLAAYGESLGQMCEQYMENIYNAAGVVFNINSPKQLGEVLFDTLGLPCPSSKRSTNAEVLEKLRPYHPIISDILEYRQVAKLKSTYTDGLVKVAGADGRIHSSFNQTVTATGRLSSTEPNLQNIPIRTELGRQLRKYFVAKDDNYVLIDADYSQIELRLLAAISGDETMTEAFKNGTDIHTVTASQVFRVPAEAVTPEMRKRAKAVNFGIVYGIGDYSLAMDIGVTKKQAGEYIDSYLKTYPAVSAYLQNIVKTAKQDGYVTTLYGRRRYIPELTASKKMLIAFGERVAMNSPIQGSAADIIKAAMVRLESELSASGLDARLILQVHDELIVECHRDCMDEVKAILKRVMENTIDLSVPLTVDVQAGDNWFDGH
ncbi:MAG: DNA polymerase I [Ruminococcaceae bacterium]|nr:DNA polymerase I [Oscillospiraceae bacterium]